MWPFWKKPKLRASSAPLFLTNTLSGKKEVFTPLRAGQVLLYSCGPTVYNKVHIGNLRSYIFSDVLARALSSAGYRVRRVINITDVGHLTGENEGDPNHGEDKLEKSARESGQRAEDIAAEYTRAFIDDIQKLNVDTHAIQFPRATQYITEQIALVRTLEKKGHTYRTPDGIYFDTTTFAHYGILGGIPEHLVKEGTADSLSDRISLAGKQPTRSSFGRIEANTEKRHSADFALWKFSPAGARRQQEWSSPWGVGFPGWHIECSAMVKALLGDTIDIHTGGIDHIPIHHNNEIAQSECVLDHPFVRYWMHNAFLTMNGEKASKSLGNVTYLSEIHDKGFHALSLRYFFLQAHYSSPISFTWEALAASSEALTRLWRLSTTIRDDAKLIPAPSEERDRVSALLRDDLSTPAALALLWEVVRDEELSPRKKWGVILAADEVLGLCLANPPGAPKVFTLEELPLEVQTLVQSRTDARKARDFARADDIRIHIERRGYRVEDRLSGPIFHEL